MIDENGLLLRGDGKLYDDMLKYVKEFLKENDGEVTKIFNYPFRTYKTGFHVGQAVN
jgi:hypothetical protein